MNVKKELSRIVSEKTGMQIGEDHVHQATRRFYYIPEAEPDKPLFLNHYRGPFFLEIPADDWHRMEMEEITPEQYVNTAKWHYGYYWGGGSMISGGYFTALEAGSGIHDVERIQKVMKAIKAQGRRVASGYMMTDEEQAAWNDVKASYLHDPRVDFFREVNHVVKELYGYELHGMCCSEIIAADSVVLYQNSTERTFELYVSDEAVKKLLYKDGTVDILKMHLYLGKAYGPQKMLVKSPEDFERALYKLGILESWEREEEKIRAYNERTEHAPAEDSIIKGGLLARFFHLFNK